jgi:hypothetical protein
MHKGLPQISGRNHSAYLQAEIVYTQILQALGAKEQASRLKKEAATRWLICSRGSAADVR